MEYVKSNCRKCNKEAYFRVDFDGKILEISCDGFPLEGKCKDCYDHWFWNKFNNGINPKEPKG